MKSSEMTVTQTPNRSSKAPTAEQTQEYLQAIYAGHQAKEKLERNEGRPEDAEALRRTVKNGERCREKLAISYLPMLTKYAERYRYRCQNVPMEDLIQEGALGMLEAIDRYHGEPIHFYTVIANRIKWAFPRVMGQQRTKQLPPQIAAAIPKIRCVGECLTKWFGRRPQPEEIAKEMSIPPTITRTLLLYNRFTIHLEKPIGKEKNHEMGDIIPAKIQTPEEIVEAKDLRERMLYLLSTLQPIEESVLKLRYGFMDEPLSDEETAEELGVNLFREQRVEVKALRKMRHPSRSQYLKDFLYD